MSDPVYAEDFQFTDMVNGVPDFLDRDGNYTKFVESDLGKAQIRFLAEQFEAKGLVEPTPEQVKALLFNEQAAQNQGYRQPDMSHDELMAQHGSTLDQVTGLVKKWLGVAHELPGEAVHAGVDAAVQGVRMAPGTGDALNALEDHKRNMEVQIGLGGPKGPGGLF